ncbi:MAG: glutathione S-transferase family protein [Ferrovibrio sp.]
MPIFELVSHALCPYVQRAAITLLEKQVPFTRTTVNLAQKPEWFKAISPLGKVPLLLVDGETLFESAAICDYLDETIAPRLHPADPLRRARHRAWIEFASAILNDIGGFYSAADGQSFEKKRADIAAKFQRLDAELGRQEGPYFAGCDFSLVDAAFAPVFRYFDVFERLLDIDIFADMPNVQAWRQTLALRPSVQQAASPDYPSLLEAFLRGRNSHLSRLMAAAA